MQVCYSDGFPPTFTDIFGYEYSTDIFNCIVIPKTIKKSMSSRYEGETEYSLAACRPYDIFFYMNCFFHGNI